MMSFFAFVSYIIIFYWCKNNAPEKTFKSPMAVTILEWLTVIQLLINIGGYEKNVPQDAPTTFAIAVAIGMFVPLLLQALAVYGMKYGHDDALKRYYIFSGIALTLNVLLFLLAPNGVYAVIIVAPYYAGWMIYFAKSKAIQRIYNENYSDPVPHKRSNMGNSGAKGRKITQASPNSAPPPAPKQSISDAVTAAGKRLAVSVRKVENTVVPALYFSFNAQTAYTAACLYFLYCVSNATKNNSTVLEQAVSYLFSGYAELNPAGSLIQFRHDVAIAKAELLPKIDKAAFARTPDLAMAVARLAYERGTGMPIPQGEGNHAANIAKILQQETANIYPSL